ncbi:hypothetical protein U9M48_029317 [Paspalum notatum var. saurae]|uniref:Reverse transcriptase domain-containing protein n=1 Tax=Paspalum notatum var. saurae TaxID=547442 RepID=A0AAQ3X2K8_PASNO
MTSRNPHTSKTTYFNKTLQPNTTKPSKKMLNSIDRDTKKTWTLQWDRNTRFFQQAILKRLRKNSVAYLIGEDGNPLTTQEQMASSFTNYFTNLFSSQNVPNMQDELQELQPPIEDEYTNSISDKQEILGIIKNMKKDAALGPDGLNVAFYRAAWPWLGEDIIKLIKDFYETDFRPISLCNVIYKIISKSLAERIKPHLPHSIHKAQSAFIPRRHITSNIIIAQEITHSFMLSTWNQKVFMLKIDLAKAFDKLNWNFILKALIALGFSHTFTNRIAACITGTSLSVIVNGQPHSTFLPSSGIR